MSLKSTNPSSAATTWAAVVELHQSRSYLGDVVGEDLFKPTGDTTPFETNPDRYRRVCGLPHGLVHARRLSIVNLV